MATLVLAGAFSADGQDLRIGLQENPDVLDPAQSRTFVGRIVFAALCDKLIDVSPDLDLVSMLSTGWEWNEDGIALTIGLREDVVFHDGTPFDAEAVAYNLGRSLNLPERRRKPKIASIAGAEAIDAHIVRIDLREPDATLIAQLADRAGMMISPTAAEASADFAVEPVC